MPAEAFPNKSILLQQAIDRFWETIPPIWSRVRSNLRTTALEQFGITVEQFHILRHINHGINSVSDLAKERSISRPAISQVVDALAHKSLLTRQQSVADRRCVKLALTESGEALIKAIFDDNRRWMLTKLEGLNQDDLTAAIHAMQIIKNTFAEV